VIKKGGEMFSIDRKSRFLSGLLNSSRLPPQRFAAFGF
jgi:hypothetical protein